MEAEGGISLTNNLVFWQGIIFAVLVVALKLVYCFVGYLTIKLGANLLREGVKGEFKFKTELQGMKADLASASPGLFFAFIGAFIIAYALFVEKPVGAAFETSHTMTTPDIKVPGELE